MAEQTARVKRVDKWDGKKRAYVQAVSAHGVTLALEGRRGARWATSPRGTIGILGASEAPGGGRWFLGLNEAQFRERRAVGLILLCEQGDETIDFVLPAERLETFLGQLSQVAGERKINLVRSRGRYIIQIPGADGADVTNTRGALDWLRPSGRDTDRRRVAAPPRAALQTPQGRFFARVRRGRLEPIDRVDLVEGEVVLVRTERVPGAPRHSSLRRILALGGPRDLPVDLAEHHDRYAHGSTRQ